MLGRAREPTQSANECHCPGDVGCSQSGEGAARPWGVSWPGACSDESGFLRRHRPSPPSHRPHASGNHASAPRSSCA